MSEERPELENPGRTTRRPPVARAQGFQDYYANNVRMRSGFMDMRITFAEVRETVANELTIVELCAVVLSPEHAKAFAEMLTKSLERYEAQFGKIRTQPERIQASAE